MISIFTDGGSRGNPGHAAIGVYIIDKDKNKIHEFGENIGIATNNVAEYKAVVAALSWLIENEELIENESNSVLNQITDVAGAADMDTDIINDSDRERQDALAVLALGIVIVPQLLNQATALFFLKKFW